MLKISTLSAAYRKDYPIIENISLNVKKGERIAITGRNGAGKSTFAKAIMKLTPFVSGGLFYKQTDLMRLEVHQYVDQGIGYFAQDGLVFPNLSVKENLEVALRGSDKDLLQQKIDKFSRLFINIDEQNFLKQKAGNLSGGERNMLALSMVMCSNPSLLILDEPFAGISPNNVKMISSFLDECIKESSCSMILIDQNQKVIEELCDKVYILKDKKLFAL